MTENFGLRKVSMAFKLSTAIVLIALCVGSFLVTDKFRHEPGFLDLVREVFFHPSDMRPLKFAAIAPPTSASLDVSGSLTTKVDPWSSPGL